jgi:hypothetical protein
MLCVRIVRCTLVSILSIKGRWKRRVLVNFNTGNIRTAPAGGKCNTNEAPSQPRRGTKSNPDNAEKQG